MELPWEQVIAAVADGTSCRQAAVRFGVNASSAIRWNALARRTGDATPGRQGGRIEVHAALILGVIKRQPDITLTELRTELAGHGVISVAGLWRFFARRRITLKKIRACGGAGPPRYPEAVPGLVRQPA